MCDETPKVTQSIAEHTPTIYEILSMGFSEVSEDEPQYLG